MRRCLLALALSVLALGAQPAAATPPKQPDPLEMSVIADVLEAEALPVDRTATNESDDGSDIEPVANDPASSPPQQAGDEVPPAETEQQSETNPAAAQPNDSSSDETVVAPAADPSAPQAEVTGGTEPQQEAAEPEAVPVNNADTSTSADTNASPSPASQSAAAGQSAERPNTTKAPTVKRVRALQVWDADQGGEPSAIVAAPPPAVGDTAAGAGVIAVPLREPDLVPPHAGGLPTLLPIELIGEISLEELAAGPISEPEASPSAAFGVAAVSVVRRERAAEKAVRPKAAPQRPAKTAPGPDQSQQNVPKTGPTPTDLKSAPTARRGPDFIVAAQRAAPGTAMNPDRPPWLITLLALLATAVSLAAITVIVLRPHLFGRKSVPPAPRPQEPESTRNEQAGIRYRE